MFRRDFVKIYKFFLKLTIQQQFVFELNIFILLLRILENVLGLESCKVLFGTSRYL